MKKLLTIITSACLLGVMPFSTTYGEEPTPGYNTKIPE